MRSSHSLIPCCMCVAITGFNSLEACNLVQSNKQGIGSILNGTIWLYMADDAAYCFGTCTDVCSQQQICSIQQLLCNGVGYKLRTTDVNVSIRYNNDAYMCLLACLTDGDPVIGLRRQTT